MEPPAGDPLMLQYRTPKEFLDCRQSVATLLSEAHVSPAQPSPAMPSRRHRSAAQLAQSVLSFSKQYYTACSSIV